MSYVSPTSNKVNKNGDFRYACVAMREEKIGLGSCRSTIELRPQNQLLKPFQFVLWHDLGTVLGATRSLYSSPVDGATGRGTVEKTLPHFENKFPFYFQGTFPWTWRVLAPSIAAGPF
jgi:hypothetical protein